MTATQDATDGATHVTPGPTLRFDVIRTLAGRKAGVPADEVTDIILAELFGTARETIWRFRTGRMKPSRTTTKRIAKILNATVEQITKPTDAEVA